MKSLWRLFISRRFAVALLIIMVGLLILAILLPDPAFLTPEEANLLKEQRPFLYKITEVLGIQAITASPFFLILPFLIFISTTICTSTRLNTRLKGKAFGIEGKVFKIDKEVVIKDGVDAAKSKLFATFKGSRWKVREVFKEGMPMLTAQRGSLGFWGSMVFHLGLLITLLAAMVTSLTLFTGEMLLTQGYPNTSKEEGFLKVWRRPLIRVKLPDARLTLEGFKAVFEEERFPVDYIASVRVEEKDSSSFLKDIRVNDPLEYYGFQYNIDRYGFAPAFVIKNKEGAVLFEGDINLVLLGGQEDSFLIPDTDYGVVARFYPDFVMTEGGPRTKSDIPNNPVFSLKLTREGITVSEGLLPMGKDVEIEDIKISFTGFKYWIHILVSRDWGTPVLFTGLVLLVAGLIIRVIFYEKRLNMAVEAMTEGCRVKVSGHTKYFPAFFEREMERLITQIIVSDINL